MKYAMCFILCLTAMVIGAGIAALFNLGLVLKFIGAEALFAALLWGVLKI